PNGCGKSNIVDAFKWVLGEQSARSLRGRQMGDMIFNGSSTRRSSGMAQVDLVFDNADRGLTLDLEEVTVSRKLYRSGESEYLINREPARLKDVREVFLDTGVGADAYSVVEQGRVDGLLQSSPAERRVIFEEAAGVSKYKARRREAQRKLDRTQQNLLRVGDVIEELEKRLRSVKLQAGKARSYKAYEERLNELRSGYAMAEYHRLTGEIERLEKSHRAYDDQLTAARTDIDRYEAEDSRLAATLDAVAEEINAADSEFIRAKSERLARQERIESDDRRAAEQEALLERARQRHDLDTRRLEEARRELAEMETQAADLGQQKDDLHRRIDGLIEEDRGHARDLTRVQAEIEDEKAGIIELLRRSARMHNEVVRLHTHRESLVGRKGRLSQRDAQIAGELQVALEQRTAHQRRQRELDELIATHVAKLKQKQVQAARVGSVRQQLIDEQARVKERRSALESRRELLEDLEQRMEGVGESARRLLDQKKQSDAPPALRDLIGLVADVFDTDVEHAPIIEVALGNAAQQLVLSKSRMLLDQPALFRDLPGRLTVLCLDRLPPIVNPRGFWDQPGVVARALDLVRFPRDYDGLARHLLGKTVVVETLEDAWRLAAGDVAGHRFVSRAGQVVEADGRVSLGPPSSGGGLISRKSELRALNDRRTEIAKRLATLEDQLNRTQAHTDHLETVQQHLRSARYEADTARVETLAAINSVTETIDRLTREQPLIAQEVTVLEQQIEEVLEKSSETSRSLEALEGENQERERRVQCLQDRIDEIVAVRLQVQEALTEARVGAGQLSEKRAAVARAVTTLGRTLSELDAAIEGVRQDIQQCTAAIEDARQSARHGRETLSELIERIESFEQSCRDLRHRREASREESEGVGQRIKEARVRLEEAESRAHELDVESTQLSVRRDELTTRTRDELAIDLVERYEDYEPGTRDWTAIEAEIQELRRKMDRLGNVNLDAVNELEELEQRHAFLASQRDDLTASHRQLERLIERLNQESRRRFEETFGEIRDNFKALFRKLFGGGRADIVLEDPEDILECGIEILAQPPGKELQAISLMSGGEKSLTAIALLMSIFSSRPAPFAILDEVDAALDEANNDRFNLIVREFVSKSQFLVITHSKWTMNMADRLYGITMQEPGVSTRVSVELTGQNVA
ncbi:MAG: chromosome segregation protein SMC, partial [Phycisphaerae bacterium]